MISNDKNYFLSHKKALTITKIVYSYLMPILLLLVAITGVLSLLESAEGSNAKQVATTLFWLCLSLSVLLFALNKYLGQNAYYQNLEPTAVKKFNLSKIIPLVLFSVIVLVPFYLLVITSLKHSAEANAVGFTWIPKQGITLINFKEVLTQSDDLRINLISSFWISMFYSFVPNLVGLLTSALAAYSFAKLYFPGRDFVYAVLIFTMVIPSCVTMTSQYVLYDYLGWTHNFLFDNTLRGGDFDGFSLVLIVPRMFGYVGTIMFLREYYKGIPDDLLASAKIDGAGKGITFLSIMIPLGAPALIAQFVLNFISTYNDVLGPLMYLRYSTQFTIQLALNMFNTFFPNRARLAAAGVIGLVPMLILYLIFQKPIMNGISISSGLKG